MPKKRNIWEIIPTKIYFFVSIRFNSVATKGTDIYNQKQLPEVFYKKRCSYKFRKIHRKTPVPESLFNKVAALRPATLLKKRLWHRYFPVNFVKSLKAGLYDEIFLSQVVKFFIRQFPFNI